jgi:alpha-1,3-glucosyltransferase
MIYLSGFGLLQLFVTTFNILRFRAATSANSTAALVETVAVRCTPEGDVACSTLEETILPVADTQASGIVAMEFLPLMVTSVYCAIGLTWAFLRLSVLYVRRRQ